MHSPSRDVIRSMPFTHSFDRERRIVRILAAGPCDLETTRAEMRSIASDPAFEGVRGVFVDSRDIQYDPTNSEVAELAEAWVGLAARRPLVFVVSTAVHVGLANMFSIYAGLHGASVAVFREVDEAEAWLSPNRGDESK